VGAALGAGSAMAAPRQRALTLREKAAQLVFIPFHGAALHRRSRQYRRFQRLVKDVRVGGLVLVNWAAGGVTPRAEPYALAAFVNRMQRLARVPLLVAADLERGASMRISGTTAFPHAMAFGAASDLNLTRLKGAITAREARALGVHWVFYPVADVNNNPDNPIINIRSFGENPESVSNHVRAFIQGARSVSAARVLTTAKHFPGHGDTAVDTHLNLASIPGDGERLRRVELAPFRAAIQAGVDSIMTAHLAVPALGVSDVPATLSPAVLTGLLRNELKFTGLIVTDALDMGGIAKGYTSGEAAVRAVEAGADVLLMPPDPEEAVNALAGAVRAGRISPRRLQDSVDRVLRAKDAMGLNQRRLVNTARIEDDVAAPESHEIAQEVADRAVTLIRNEGSIVPLADPARTCYLLLAESRTSTQGRAMAEEIRRRAPNASILELDPTVDIESIVSATAGTVAVVVAAFSQVGAYRSNAQLAGGYPTLLEALFAARRPIVMAALGNPYLLRHYGGVAAYLAAYSTVEASEIAAVKALFGEIDIRGRLPVSIPGCARYGEGIQLVSRA
jgi:beta-N-acetylhexosaminidase